MPFFFTIFIIKQRQEFHMWKNRTHFQDTRYKYLTHLKIDAKNGDIMLFLSPYFSTTNRKEPSAVLLNHTRKFLYYSHFLPFGF